MKLKLSRNELFPLFSKLYTKPKSGQIFFRLVYVYVLLIFGEHLKFLTFLEIDFLKILLTASQFYYVD